MHHLGVTMVNPFSEVIVREGNTTTITCETLGYPPPTIVWSRTNGTLSDRVSVSDSVSVPTGYGNVTRVSVNMTITNASREDTGVYMCSANNSVGSDTKSINITVQCKFIFYLIYLESCLFIVQTEVISDVTDLFVNETNPITFSCQVTGEPVPFISWYFKGVTMNVSDASKYNISNTLSETTVTSLLMITNVKSSDAGTYACQAENIIGIDRSSGVLTVNSKFVVRKPKVILILE